MSYTVTISGDDTDASALGAFLEGVDLAGTYGATSAQLVAGDGTTTDLLPAPPADPYADLDAAVKDLDDALGPLNTISSGDVTLTGDQALAILTAQSEIAAAVEALDPGAVLPTLSADAPDAPTPQITGTDPAPVAVPVEDGGTGEAPEVTEAATTVAL